MRLFTFILILIALGLLTFNLTQLNWSAPLEGDSMVALITSLALACAILLLLILRVSKKIESKTKDK